ncbi:MULTISPECIES: hypothetical protein [Salinibaculum]|uniref:hypothetical protein n=1 Tax=Salinibaculum TaxID=2732368 RepID=UPI0030CD2561
MKNGLIARYRDWWTRLFVRFVHGGVEKVDRISTSNGEQTVYYFSSDSAIIGQKTWGAETILLNKPQFEHLPDLSAERTVEHEVGHLNRHSIWNGIFWGSVVSLAFGIVSFLLLLTLSVIHKFPILGYPRLLLIISGMVVVGLFALKMNELLAELYVLDQLSEEEYLKAEEEMPVYDVSKKAAIAAEIVYPSPETVVKVHRIKEDLKARIS